MKAVAPGKLILSGEHAVVHGCPALVTAVSRHASAAVSEGDGDRVCMVTPFGEQSASAQDLMQRLTDAQARYQEFLIGRRTITDVVPRPMDYLFLAWPLLESAPCGIRIEIDSTIPLGSGMGSSAAVSVALLQALAAWGDIAMDADKCQALSLAMETFQHGHPSGVDSFVAVHGGMIRYTKGTPPVTLNSAIPPLQLVDTGTPESTTGECVEQVRSRFVDSAIWDEFSAVCSAVEQGCSHPDPTQLLHAVRRNHRLLLEIGVVPVPVAEWIGRIEENGGAAKICGAGSIRGGAGGIVWVIGDIPPASPYDQFVVEGETHGVHFID